MDWQSQLISLFLFLSKCYETELYIYCERLSRNTDPEFSDVEVLSIYLWGIMRNHHQIRDIYRYTQEHLSAWYPRLPAYATYVQRLNRISSAFEPLIARIQADFPHTKNLEMIRLMDSMPIILAKAQRSSGAKVAKELANKGYNATKKTYFYGVKLHILAFRRTGTLPLPDYIGLTPASEADIHVLKFLADEIHLTPVYADKAYIDAALACFLEQQQALLLTPAKKKKGQKELSLFQKAHSTLISKVRQPIESLFNWIQEKTGIQIASKVRSTKGLLVHVFGKMTAACFLLAALG